MEKKLATPYCCLRFRCSCSFPFFLSKRAVAVVRFCLLQLMAPLSKVVESELAVNGVVPCAHIHCLVVFLFLSNNCTNEKRTCLSRYCTLLRKFTHPSFFNIIQLIFNTDPILQLVTHSQAHSNTTHLKSLQGLGRQSNRLV